MSAGSRLLPNCNKRSATTRSITICPEAGSRRIKVPQRVKMPIFGNDAANVVPHAIQEFFNFV